MDIITQLVKLYRTPFYACYIDVEKDIKKQKAKISAEICKICKTEKPLSYSFDIYSQMIEDPNAPLPNAVIFKIPKDIIIVDTDDQIADNRFRSLFPDKYLDECATPSISRALGINMEKGYHYYHIKKNNFDLGAQKWQNKGGEIGDIDILASGGSNSGFIIEHIDSILPETTILPMDEKTFQLITGKPINKNLSGSGSDTERSESDTIQGDFINELEEKFRSIEVWRKWAELTPNPDNVTREEWLSVAKFFYKHFPEQGYEIFSIWSEKWEGYNSSNDLRMWRTIKYQNETTIGTPIFFIKKWAGAVISRQWFNFVDSLVKSNSDPFISSVKTDEIFGNTDEDFSLIAYEKLKDNFVYSCGQIYYKVGNIWSTDIKAFQAYLRSAIIALKMKKKNIKVNKKGEETITEVYYCEMVKNLKNVCVLTEDKIMENQNPEFFQKFHNTTLGKLCFNDGVYNFEKRKFSTWDSDELKRDPVFSLVKINRNFPKSIDSEFKNECYKKIFEASMGEENAAKWVAFLSRAVAGKIEDKLFASILTDRDCSKGVTNDWLMAAFGAYVRQAESKNFLVQRDRSGTDAAKENAWLVDFQPVRLMLVQEFPLDMNNKGLKANSTLIKSINSGGDQIEGRKNFKDAATFNIQCTTIFMVNDLPNYTSNDVLEKCLQLTSTIQFKSADYIEKELKDAEGNEELLEFRKKNFKLADPDLRHNVKKTDWADALVHIIIDNYRDQPVSLPKSIIEGDQDIRLDEKVLNTFILSGNDSDFCSNEDLRRFSDDWGCSLKKLKIKICAMNNKIREGIQKDGKKQYKGFRGISLKEDVEECD